MSLPVPKCNYNKAIDLTKYKRKGGYDGWLYLGTYPKPNLLGFNMFLDLKNNCRECFGVTVKPYRLVCHSWLK